MTDGQGYYAYLPAVFIYHDLQFSFVDSINQAYYPEDKRAKFVVPSDDGNVNKYFVGTAITQAPFFIVGCFISKLVGQPIDGYSWPFQLMVGIAALFYLAAGLWFLSRLLNSMSFSEHTIQLTVIFIVLATNLLHYSLFEPSMSHVYSFCTVSAFLFYGRNALANGQKRELIGAALMLGLTVLIRPINGLVLLAIPVVAGGIFGTIQGLEATIKHKKEWLISILVFVLLVALQPIIYLLETGHPFVWSYQEEGFNFLAPELQNVLFSYRKGLFVYCPILILSVLGMIAGLRRKREIFLPLLGVLALISWVIASWWMWYYGGSYGHRAFIEFYPLFAMGLAYLIQHGFGFLKPALVVLIGILLVVVQVIQTYQYNTHIIPFDSMNETKYWNVFLRTGKDLRWYYSGYPGEDSYNGIDSALVLHTMEGQLGWGNEDLLTTEQAFEGEGSYALVSEKQYGITFRKPVNELSTLPNTVRISGMFKSDSRNTDLSLVCSIEDSTGTAYYWRSYPLRPQFNGSEWSWATSLNKCGYPRDSTDRFVIYPMKSDGATVYIDNLEISFIKAQ